MRDVEFLLENETMSGKQFVQCMKGETIEGGSATAMFDDFTETEEFIEKTYTRFRSS